MAWDDAPPTAAELNSIKTASAGQTGNWDDTPPTQDELKAVGAVQPKQYGKATTALDSAANALTLGYLPEIDAKLQPIGDRIKNAAKALVGQPTTEPAPMSQLTSNGPEYIAARDKNAAILKEEQSQNPKTAIGGMLGGGLLTTPMLPGLGIAKGAGEASVALRTLGMSKGAATAARMVGGATEAAVQGGLIGAASNPGSKEGVVDTTQGAQRGENAISGAKVGGVLGTAGEAILEGIQNMPAIGQSIKDKAYSIAFKALGPYVRDVRAQTPESIKRIGKTVLDEGVITMKPGDYNELAHRATNALETKGEEFEEQLNAIAAAAEKSAQPKQNFPSPESGVVGPWIGSNRGPNPMPGKAGLSRSSIVDSLKEDLTDGVKKQGVPTLDAEQDAFKSMINQFEKGTEGNPVDPIMSIKEAQNLKSAIGKKINWNRDPRADIPTHEVFMRSLYYKLKTGVEDAAEALAGELGPDARANWIQVKNEYGALKTAAAIANARAQRTFVNRFISPTDYLAIIGGAALGGPIGLLKGAVLGGLNHIGRNYGNEVLSKSLELGGRATQSLSGGAQRNIVPLVPMYQRGLINAGSQSGQQWGGATQGNGQ